MNYFELPRADEIKSLKRRLIVQALISIPGTLALAAGIFGFFAEDPTLLHPWLASPKNVYALLLAGGFVNIYFAFRRVPLIRKLKALQAEELEAAPAEKS